MSSQLIRQDLVPIGVGYALLMIVLAVGLLLQRRQARRGSEQGRRPVGRRLASQGSGWIAVALNVGRDIIGGYLLLIAVVILYYYGVAKVGGSFLESAFTGPALLIGLAMPVFIAASLLSRRRARRRQPSPGPGRRRQGGS